MCRSVEKELRVLLVAAKSIVGLLNNEKFEIPLFRSATGQRTFAYRAVSLLNMLDKDLRNATTVKAFKKALKLVMNE